MDEIMCLNVKMCN